MATNQRAIVMVELDEGSLLPVFAPVDAVHLGATLYRLLPDGRRDLVNAKFKPPTVVHCLLVLFEGEPKPTAFTAIPDEAVDYLLSF